MKGSPQKEAPLTLAPFMEFYEKTIEPRLSHLMDDRISVLKNKMNGHFDDLYKTFETLEQEYVVIKGQLKRIDQRLDKIDLQISY